MSTRASIAVHTLRHNYAVTPVTTGAWVELQAAMPADCNEIEVFDSGGQTMELGYGPPGSEKRSHLITPGGNGRIASIFNREMRVAVKAVSADATAGELVINFYR